MAGDSIRAIARGVFAAAWLALATVAAQADEPESQPAARGGGLPFLEARRQRQEALDALPLNRLTPEATRQILDIAESPTLYRRLPVQAIECDRDMFLFLTRNPEVLVGMWQLMGITQVETERVGPYQLEAEDGNGTECEVDLVYGDANLHVFVARGSYSGRLVTAPVRGQGVFILRSSYAQSSSGGTTVTGVLDCFIQLDHLAADLIARTFSSLIGRSADHNFVETARFMTQVSQMSEKNPSAMIELADRLPQVEPPTRRRFAEAITTVARRAEADERRAARVEKRVASGELRDPRSDDVR